MACLACQALLACLDKKETEVQLVLMAPKENKEMQALRVHLGTQAIWEMRGKKEKRDLLVHQERQETKGPRAVEASRGKRANLVSLGRVACRATGGCQACLGHRGQRGKCQVIHISNRFA